MVSTPPPDFVAKPSAGTPDGVELPSLIETLVFAPVVTSAAETLWVYPGGAGTDVATGCCASAVDESGALVASETLAGVILTALVVPPPHAARIASPKTTLTSEPI